MKSPAWIAGSLLILAMAQTTQAQQERLAQEPRNAAPPAQLPPVRLPPPRPAGMDAQPLRDNTRLIKRERLTPEERQRLRQDINEAGRDLYRREQPGHF